MCARVTVHPSFHTNLVHWLQSSFLQRLLTLSEPPPPPLSFFSSFTLPNSLTINQGPRHCPSILWPFFFIRLVWSLWQSLFVFLLKTWRICIHDIKLNGSKRIRWIKWSKCTRWFLMIQKITDPSFLDLVVLAAELPRRHRDWCCHLAALAACTSKKQHRERDHSPKTRGFYQNGFRIKGSTGLMDLRKLGYDFYHLNIHNNSCVGCCFVSFFF